MNWLLRKIYNFKWRPTKSDAYFKLKQMNAFWTSANYAHTTVKDDVMPNCERSQNDVLIRYETKDETHEKLRAFGAKFTGASLNMKLICLVFKCRRYPRRGYEYLFWWHLLN